VAATSAVSTGSLPEEARTEEVHRRRQEQGKFDGRGHTSVSIRVLPCPPYQRPRRTCIAGRPKVVKPVVECVADVCGLCHLLEGQLKVPIAGCGVNTPVEETPPWMDRRRILHLGCNEHNRKSPT
jgi:hypothetical protein